MNLKELKNRIIEDGLESIKKHEADPERKGGIKGFGLCRDLNTPKDFEQVLKERYANELDMQMSYHKIGKPTIERYWEHRYTTLQIEFCFEVLKVAWNLAGITKYPTLSARAGIKYAELVGVNN